MAILKSVEQNDSEFVFLTVKGGQINEPLTRLFSCPQPSSCVLCFGRQCVTSVLPFLFSVPRRVYRKSEGRASKGPSFGRGP